MILCLLMFCIFLDMKCLYEFAPKTDKRERKKMIGVRKNGKVKLMSESGTEKWLE